MNRCIALACSFICLAGCGERKHAYMRDSQEYCRIFDINGWHATEETLIKGDFDPTRTSVEFFRRGPDAIAATFHWSTSAYELRFDAKTLSPIRVSYDEIAKGIRLLNNQNDPKLELYADRGQPGSQWPNGRYHLSGSYPVRARYSPGKSYVEIWSHNISGDRKYNGSYFVEVFRIRDQRRMGGVENVYRNWHGGLETGSSVWASDGDFALFTGESNEQCMICRFPEEKQ